MTNARTSASLLYTLVLPTDDTSTTLRRKKNTTQEPSSNTVCIILLIWAVFVFLTLIRFTDLMTNRFRQAIGRWRLDRHLLNDSEHIGEQRPLVVKKVSKEVRFSDEKILIPAAGEFDLTQR